MNAQDADRDRTERSLTFQFTATGAEFFRLWIVNVCLTIFTLGVYSAWAKVRTTKYLYNHTLLDNIALDYSASPIAILKGRLIAAGCFTVYFVIAQMAPVLAMALLPGILVLLTPWMVMKSLSFRFAHTSYRNIRFRFKQDWLGAIRVFVGWPLLAVMTLGLLFPHVLHRQTRYIVQNSRYGASRFRFNARVGQYYRVYLFASVLMFLGGLAAGAFSGLALSLRLPLLLPAGFALGVACYYYAAVYLRTELANITWNHIAIDTHQFESTMSTGKMAWIYLSNAFLIAATLGLYTPWAKIRSMRYRKQCLTLHMQGTMDEVSQAAHGNTTATAEGMADVFEVEVGM